MPENPATKAAADAENSRTFQVLARLGYAVNGLLHVLIGVIALSVVVGGGGGEADQSGALSQLASNPAGVALLWLIVVGLFALGLWQIVAGFQVRRSDPKKAWGKRVSEFGKALAYLAVGVTALTFALGGSKSSSGSSQGASATALATPGGVFAVVAVGLVVFGIGVFFIVRGISRRFTKDLRMPAGTAGRIVVVLGTVGYIAKGIALAVVGALFVVAAATFDASKATGLDGALKALAALPFGAVILIVIGIGLIAYGAYLGARARWGRL
ncbi:DUF1206 domain-containing protein [Subtercola boreus]|uniref:DUF1206 domain-containing protein n=1 Tax=Subtercola boreus TaxID=120213 RepID=A0A3E0WG21_9MICO|nr:DUF1206 domain-containing protein [Subtercola boreus]RFA23383.1 hypothetical protein B7R24_00320 [Subtercola boreus]RFA23776.1 hypothetical protein B7R23_00320 [Subtercola boreus]RFA29477.1 hypothetical protein B7R25_00315 [Subtercola boreus]